MNGLTFAFLLLIILMCFLVFMWIRNDWVYKQTMTILEDPNMDVFQRNSEYDRLPSYNAMLLRWWCWDIEKFKALK